MGRRDGQSCWSYALDMVRSNKTAIAVCVAVPVVIWAVRYRARKQVERMSIVPLQKRIDDVLTAANKAGAIVPLATDDVRVVYAGDAADSPVMVVHVKSPTGAAAYSTTGKHAPKAKRDAFAGHNELAVADLFGTHRLVLNKFPLMEKHVVVHTIDFVEQNGHMSFEDFRATWHCTKELDGIAYFNCGPLSGASQPRRHMQIIPIKSIEAKQGSQQPFQPVPVERLVSKFRQRHDWKYEPGKPFRLSDFNFQHAVSLHGGDVHRMVEIEAAGKLYAHYQRLLKEVDLLAPADCEDMSYNFLMTRSWMMVVPRGAEKWNGVGLNAMAFSCIFVLPVEKLADFSSAPLALLRAITLPTTE